MIPDDATAAEAVGAGGTSSTVLISIAVIAAVGSCVAAVIGRRVQRENRTDHGEVVAQLGHVAKSVQSLDENTTSSLRRVHERLDHHLEWHAGMAERRNDDGNLGDWDGVERRAETRDPPPGDV